MKALRAYEVRQLLDYGMDTMEIMDVDARVAVGEPFPINTEKTPYEVFESGFEDVDCRVIYGIFDLGECIYVGQTKRLHLRCQEHCRNYGFTPDQFRILEYVYDDSRWNLAELDWIHKFRPKLNKHKP